MSYDRLTDVGGQMGGCQQLSQRKGVCFLLNKKETLSGWIQAARLQPLVEQYKKPTQHQTFAIEKFRDLIVITRSCPGDKKISLKLKNILFEAILWY